MNGDRSRPIAPCAVSAQLQILSTACTPRVSGVGRVDKVCLSAEPESSTFQNAAAERSAWFRERIAHLVDVHGRPASDANG